jgi:dephospho-CoA kinase
LEEIALADPQGIAVVEAALLFEAGVGDRFDKMVVVICKHPSKLARYAERVLAASEKSRPELGPISRGQRTMEAYADAERRIALQMPDEEKRRRADYVIENDGTREELETKVEDVVKSLQALAG